MKKTIALITTAILSSALLFGCGSKAAATDASGNTQNSTSQSQNNQQGRGQFQMADLSGQVTAVSGNQITIKVIKQQAPRQQGDNKNDNTGNNGSTNNSNGSNSGNNDSNGGNNSNGSQGNNNGNSGSSNGQGKENRQRRQPEFTGETKTITISDGVQITTMNRGNQQNEAKTLTVKDIAVGNEVQVWYSDKDKETVSKVNVMQFNLNKSNNGNNNSNGNNSSTDNTSASN